MNDWSLTCYSFCMLRIFKQNSVSLLLARGWHFGAEQAIRLALQRISSLLLFLMISRRTIISGSAGPIFAIRWYVKVMKVSSTLDTTCIFCTSVWKRIGISLSICVHQQQRWPGYICYKFGGLLTSTSRVQLCTTGIDQWSGKYIYVRQVTAWLCFATTC